MGPTIIPPIIGIIIIQYQFVAHMFCKILPGPGKEISEIVFIIHLIPIPPNPPRIPIMIASIIIKVCSVILARSNRSDDFLERNE